MSSQPESKAPVEPFDAPLQEEENQDDNPEEVGFLYKKPSLNCYASEVKLTS